LIQGLSGFKGLLNDIPKLIDNFKGWFRWLDPVEKKIDNIASNIANIDLKKLDASGNGDPKFDVIDKKDLDTVKQYNIETEKQNQIFGDYNKQRSILNQQLQQQKTHQESVKTALQEELAQTYALADAFNEKRKERQLLESEFARTDKLDINRRIELKAQIEAVKKSEAKLGEQLKATNEQFIDQSKNLAEVEAALAETEKEIAKIDKG
jgi:chromosome segregation ATPase